MCKGIWRAPLLVAALLVGLPTAAAAADTPVDPGLPVPTVAPGQDCGTAAAPAWTSVSIPSPAGMSFTIGVPRPTVNGVQYQGVVQVWDVDDPSTPTETAVDGLPSLSQSVYVPLSPADGHTYAWSAQTYDGTSYSAATTPCYFTVDAGRPLVSSVTNPDFPRVGTPGTPRKAAEQPTTFTIDTADVLPAGCTTAGGPDCAVSGVKDVRWALDEAPSPGGSSTVPVDSQGRATVTVTPNWGVHTLYVEAEDGAGNLTEDVATYTFTVPSELPPAAASSIHLSAPSTAARAAKLAVTGQVSPGTYTLGEVVHVTRTDLAHPAGVALPDAALSADGSFRISDTPQVGGANTYRVSFAGDALQQAATASATVQVSRVTPALTLASSGGSHLKGSTVTLTAHLGSTYNSRTVAIYAQPVSGTKVKLKSAAVNAKGVLAVSYKLARSTTFTAVYAGDDRYAPRSVSLTVTAVPTVSGSLEYSSGTLRSGKTVYKEFHHGHHQPVFQAKASLAQAGGCYRATVQRYYSHAWHTLKTSGCVAVAKNGVAAYTVPWGSLPVNGLFRIRTHYAPPAKGAIGAAAWSSQSYFTIKAH